MIVPFICLSFYILLMLTTGKLWLVRCLGSMSRFCSRPQSSWRRVVTKLTIGFWFSPPTGCLSWQPRNWSLFWAVKEPCKNVKSKSLQLSTYLPLGPQMILDTYIDDPYCHCLLYLIALLNTNMVGSGSCQNRPTSSLSWLSINRVKEEQPDRVQNKRQKHQFPAQSWGDWFRNCWQHDCHCGKSCEEHFSRSHALSSYSQGK